MALNTLFEVSTSSTVKFFPTDDDEPPPTSIGTVCAAIRVHHDEYIEIVDADSNVGAGGGVVSSDSEKLRVVHRGANHELKKSLTLEKHADFEMKVVWCRFAACATRSLCILTSPDTLHVFGDDCEDFVVRLPCRCDGIFEMPEGLLIQRDTAPDHFSHYSSGLDVSMSPTADLLGTSHGGVSNLWAAQNEQSMLRPTSVANMSSVSMAGSVFSQGGAAQEVPAYFSLLHPLEEVKPVGVYQETIFPDISVYPMESELLRTDCYFANTDEKVVHAFTKQPLLVTYNEVTERHTVYRVRQSQAEIDRRWGICRNVNTNGWAAAASPHPNVTNMDETARTQKENDASMMSSVNSIAGSRLNNTTLGASHLDSTYHPHLPAHLDPALNPSVIDPEVYFDKLWTDPRPVARASRVFMATGISRDCLICFFSSQAQELRGYNLNVANIPDEPRFVLKCRDAVPIRTARNSPGEQQFDTSKENIARRAFESFDYDILVLETSNELALYSGQHRVQTLALSSRKRNPQNPSHSPENGSPEAARATSYVKPGKREVTESSMVDEVVPDLVESLSPPIDGESQPSSLELRVSRFHDPVENRVTVSCLNGRSYRIELALSPVTPLVRSCFYALATTLSPETAHALRVDFEALSREHERVHREKLQSLPEVVSGSELPAMASEWEVFRDLLKHALADSATMEDEAEEASASSPVPFSPKPGATPTHRSVGSKRRRSEQAEEERFEGEENWRRLLNSSYHAQHYSDCEFSALSHATDDAKVDHLSSSPGTETSENSGFALACKDFPSQLDNALASLHLLYETFKVDRTMREHRKPLATVLVDLALKANRLDYVDFYSRDYSDLRPSNEIMQQAHFPPDSTPPPMSASSDAEAARTEFSRLFSSLPPFDVYQWFQKCVALDLPLSDFMLGVVPFEPYELLRKVGRFYELLIGVKASEDVDIDSPTENADPLPSGSPSSTMVNVSRPSPLSSTLSKSGIPMPHTPLAASQSFLALHNTSTHKTSSAYRASERKLRKARRSAPEWQSPFKFPPSPSLSASFQAMNRSALSNLNTSTISTPGGHLQVPKVPHANISLMSTTSRPKPSSSGPVGSPPSSSHAHLSRSKANASSMSSMSDTSSIRTNNRTLIEMNGKEKYPPFSPWNSEDDGHPRVPASTRHERVVSAMVEEGFTLEHLRNLEPGVSLPLHSAILMCRRHAPGNWPSEAYYLIGRDDLAKNTLLSLSDASGYALIDRLPGRARESNDSERTSSDGADADRFALTRGQSRKEQQRRRIAQRAQETLAFGLGIPGVGDELYDMDANAPGGTEKKSLEEEDDDPSGTLYVCKLNKTRFRDLRLKEVRRLLRSDRAPIVRIPDEDKKKEEDLPMARQARLMTLLVRSYSMPIARGMFTFATAPRMSTDTWTKFPVMRAEGRVPPKFTTLEIEERKLTSSMVDWPHFHNGAAMGLRMPRNAPVVTRESILAIHADPEIAQSEFAGFILGLGFSGHLSKITYEDAHNMFNISDDKLQVALILGLSVNGIGSMDHVAAKLVCIHIPQLLASDDDTPAPDTHASTMVQTAALIGIGLLYCGTRHAYMSNIMLNAIGERPANDTAISYGSYSLAAGLSLGFLCLGMAEHVPAFLNIDDRLERYIKGGQDRHAKKKDFIEFDDPLGISSNAHHDPTAERPGKDRSTPVNVNMSAPGATLAMGLIYLKSNNTVVANRLALPTTYYMLERSRADFLFYRVLSRSLILWDSVTPTQEWLDSLFPKIILKNIHVDTMDRSARVDNEAISESFCYIAAAAAVSIGIRYAGSHDRVAFVFVRRLLKRLITIQERNNMDIITVHPKVSRLCVNMAAIAMSLVMAGTGDLDAFRLLLALRSEVQQGSCPTAMNPGSYMAVSMAIGFLFLSGGRATLSTSDRAVAGLITSLFPIFPEEMSCNKYHLQPLRHFYALAVEHRLVEARDVDTGESCHLPLKIHVKATATHGTNTTVIMTPALIPPYDEITKISVDSPRYWNVELDLDANMNHVVLVRDKRVIFVKRKSGNLPHDQDPTGVRSLVSHRISLGAANKSVVSANRSRLELSQMFIHHREAHHFARQFCSGETVLDKLCVSALRECVLHDKGELLPIYAFLRGVVDRLPSSATSIDFHNLKLVVEFAKSKYLSSAVDESATRLSHMLRADFVQYLDQRIRRSMELGLRNGSQSFADVIKNYLHDSKFPNRRESMVNPRQGPPVNVGDLLGCFLILNDIPRPSEVAGMRDQLKSAQQHSPRPSSSFSRPLASALALRGPPHRTSHYGVAVVSQSLREMTLS